MGKKTDFSVSEVGSVDIHLENKINLDLYHTQNQLQIQCELMHLNMKVEQ